MNILGKEIERSKLHFVIFTVLFLSALLAMIAIKIRMDGIGFPVFLMLVGFIGIAATLLTEIMPDQMGFIVKKIRTIFKIKIAFRGET